VAASVGTNAETFAAPGCREFMAAHRMPSVDLQHFHILNIFRRHDIVSSLGTHVGKVRHLEDIEHSPAELPRILAAGAADSARVAAERQALLPRLEADHKRDAEHYAAVYQRAMERYAETMATYHANVAAFKETNKNYSALWRAGAWLTSGIKEPAKPTEVVSMTAEERARTAVPDPFAEASPLARAKFVYGGMPGYLYRNHTLDPYLEQFEHEAHVPHWPQPVGSDLPDAAPAVPAAPAWPPEEAKVALPAPAAPPPVP
jgi:hypothetical protein